MLSASMNIIQFPFIHSREFLLHVFVYKLDSVRTEEKGEREEM